MKDTKTRSDMSYGTGAKYGGSSMQKGKTPVKYQGMKTVVGSKANTKKY